MNGSMSAVNSRERKLVLRFAAVMILGITCTDALDGKAAPMPRYKLSEQNSILRPAAECSSWPCERPGQGSSAFEGGRESSVDERRKLEERLREKLSREKNESQRKGTKKARPE